MDTPDNIQEDAVAVAMARGIRDISKALTSHAYGETPEIICVKLDDAKRHIEKAVELVTHREETETREPPAITPEEFNAALGLTEAGSRAADVAENQEALIGHDFPDDAPEKDDNPEDGIEVEEEMPDHEDGDDGDGEENADDDDGGDDFGLGEDEDDPDNADEEQDDGMPPPFPEDLAECSRLIYMAAKVINRCIDNKYPIDTSIPPVATVTYAMARWIANQEQERGKRGKAARHLRHIARFIAKCKRRGEFHHVRKVRKFRG